MTKRLNNSRPLFYELLSIRHIALFIIVFSCYGSFLAASPLDSISSVYKDGEFKSHYQVKLKVSDTVVSNVTNKLIKDFQSPTDYIFTWALKDLGLQNDEELIITFKSSTYNPKTGISHGVFDIEIPGVKKFRDVKLDAIVSKTKYTSGASRVTAHIIYSSLLLKYALGTLTIVPLKNNEKLFITNVSIKFGWFFNIFITKRRYKSIVEWRIKKFTENMHDECVLQQRNITKNGK